MLAVSESSTARQNIEMWLKDGHKPEEIGRLLGGRSKRTIYREIANGRVKLLNSDLTERIEYSADVAQKKHNYNATAKGPSLKIGKNYRLVQFIEDKIIKEKFSPSAALEEAKKEGYEVNIYAHPYSAWERGSNENFNKLVRRFIPKGADITKYSKKYIAYIQHWINHYPRKKLNWKSSSELSFYTNSFA